MTTSGSVNYYTEIEDRIMRTNGGGATQVANGAVLHAQLVTGSMLRFVVKMDLVVQIEGQL